MDRVRCVTLDPPWIERGAGKSVRGAQRHYPLMPTKDIIALVVRTLSGRVARDAHCWCWVTDNFLFDGAAVMERLGFRYVRTFCWVKTGALDDEEDSVPMVEDEDIQLGLGQYARGAHELCLFGVCGNAMVPPAAMRPKSVLFAPRSRHSEKPELAYLRWFEKVSPAPRLEMFARRERPGWQVWGNEV